jgi:hypothetical protein
MDAAVDVIRWRVGGVDLERIGAGVHHVVLGAGGDHEDVAGADGQLDAVEPRPTRPC